MSYILDALKRADAERVRGVVPGLHAHQSPWDETEKPARRRTSIVVGMVTLAIVGVVSVSMWLWRSTAPAVVTPTVQQTAQTATPTPAPSAPATTPPTATTPTAVVSLPAPSTVAPAVPVTPPPGTVSAPKPQAAPLSVKTDNKGATATVLPSLTELPEDLRRQLPALAITGAVYSENPGQRLLLINGQVLPQGSAAAPDVTLEEIRERYSIFSFRGTRFRVAH